jgi:hypothetical protein
MAALSKTRPGATEVADELAELGALPDGGSTVTVLTSGGGAGAAVHPASSAAQHSPNTPLVRLGNVRTPPET